MSEAKTIQLDLRQIPVFERHPRIFDTWDQMEAGDTLRIINDHDPKPLHYQFEGEYENSYKWDYITKGGVAPLAPEWVVDIKKLDVVIPLGEDLRNRIEEALNEVRPYLEADGGGVELVDIDEVSRTVRVRLQGACGGCPSAGMTLKAGVEKTIKKYAPGIKSVEAV